MTTFKNSFEGGTAGTVVTTGNSGGASGDAFANVAGNPTFSATGKMHGSLGCRWNLGTATAWRAYHSWTATGSVAGRAYMTLNSLPSAGRTLLTVINSTFASNVKVQTTAANKLQVTDAAGTVLWTAANALVAGTVYRLEVQTSAGTTTTNGMIAFQYYAGDSTTPAETGYSASNVNAGAGSQIVRGQLGNNDSTTIDVTFDDVQWNTGTTTPVGPPASPPTASFTYGVVALTVSVDGTGSSAVSPATLSSYAWDWGDGNTDTGSTASHAYASGGTYLVALTVTDSAGQTGSVTQSVTVAAPAGTVTAQSVDVSTGWTPSSGTALACITDGDGTTFVSSSSPPTGQEFDITLQAVTAPSAGQPFKVFLTLDATLATSATLNAQLFEGATQRSALTGVAIASGSGGTVTNVVTLTFPWTDVQNVTTGGWNALKLKLQVTAS